MQFGFVLPYYQDARTAAGMAYEAEHAGWDGVFAWEPVWGVDAWVTLTAAAMHGQPFSYHGQHYRVESVEVVIQRIQAGPPELESFAFH